MQFSATSLTARCFQIPVQDSVLPAAMSTSNREIDLEAASLAMGGPRIKFSVVRVDSDIKPDEKLAMELAEGLAEMEAANAAPVLPDGKVGGNGAVRMRVKTSAASDDSSQTARECMLVSKSGKAAGEQLSASDFALVHSFNSHTWTAHYSSSSDNIKPSSDSCLLWTALFEGHRFGFDRHRMPTVALHGHALAAAEDEHKHSFPISHEQTLFSTREDVDALTRLFATHPYPAHRVFIRRCHGFFILADSISEARDIFRTQIVPKLQPERPQRLASKL